MRFNNHLSRADLKACIALGIILTLIVLGVGIYSHRSFPKSNTSDSITSADEVHKFWKEIKTQEKFRKENTTRQRHNPFHFDPNTADSLTLIRLGLPHWVVRHILHYREAGGKFRKPSDFKKIYGLSIQDYQALLPYITIKSSDQEVITATEGDDHIAKAEQPQRNSNSSKYTTSVSLDLNNVDSLSLVRIPGIGQYFSHRILRYRQLLGGYVSTQQLHEINGLPLELERWFYVQAPKVQQLKLNRMEFRDLLRHPYLNYEQVKAIVRHRQQFGPLQSLQQLRNEDAFSEEDLKRLAPYISFDLQ